MKAFVDSIAAGARPSIAQCVEALGGAIPAMFSLKDTPQDPGWHAEGNVFVHTGMVLDALYALLEGRAASITGHRRTALILGAALDPTATRAGRAARVGFLLEDGDFHADAATLSAAGTDHLERIAGRIEHVRVPIVVAATGNSDLDNGRRYATMADFERLVKVNQTLEYTHHSGLVICEPTDVPVNKRHLDMLAMHFRYGSKPLLGAITAPERALDSIEMARLVFDDGFLEDHCVIMGNINVNSPLVFDGQVTQVIRHYAAANQGMVICPFILGGAMGPVTPAGAVAQAHAEAMVGVALTQLVRPGAPAIYGNFLTTMSLRSGAPTFGTPEAGLAYFAVGQLARRLGIPVRCGGAYTSAKLPDAQAAQESANSMLTAMMSGANFVLHAAGWLEGGLVMDYEKLVLDNDRLGMLHHMLRGMPLDDNAFAMDGFHEVGPGSHFLGSAHTLANYETAYYESTFGDSMSWEQWREEGEVDARQRANADWKARLENYEQPPLAPGVDEALDGYVAKKKDAVPDAWY